MTRDKPLRVHCIGRMLQGQYTSWWTRSGLKKKKKKKGTRLNNAFSLVHFNFVVVTVSKSNAQYATLKTRAILSPQHVAPIQTSWISGNMLRSQNLSVQHNLLPKTGCHLENCHCNMSPLHVPATCPRSMSPQHVPAACPRYMSPLHAPATCPRNISPSVCLIFMCS